MPVAVGAASVFTTRKVVAYGVLSTMAALAVVLGAFRQRSNFYSAAVMLGRSNGCMMVLFNFALFLTICFGKVCQKVFFGPLRSVEVEHIYERSWYAVTESLLAMTIFRDEFGANFVLLFSTLLFLKVFHWLSADRVEYMEQTPSVNRLFHIRMVSVLWTLFCLDLFLVAFAIEVLILDKNRMGIMIMFASEYMILSATLWSTVAKYVINVQDSRSDEPWEAKSMYVFFVDLATDFLKLMTYMTFFALILSFYGLPLNIIRDVFLTARSFFGRVRDFIKYRAATKNMDTRFPDATRQDLSSMSDGTCIICREEMTARGHEDEGGAEQSTPNAGAASRGESGSGLNETPKKLPCGHIFHFHCLRSWLERQQSCPTCRRTVFAAPEAQNGIGANGPAAATTRPGQANRTIPVGNNSGAGDIDAGGNASQTARDRLQSFLQQLQTDAQRVRERAEPQMPRATPAPNTTSAQFTNAPSALPSSQNDNRSINTPASADIASNGRRREPVQKALIGSLFGQSGREGGSAGNLNAGANGSTRVDQKNDLVSSLVPPAPWTMKASKITNSQEIISIGEDSSTSSKTDAGKAASSSNNYNDSAEEDANEQKMPLDPADAREAARAAALKRFGLKSESIIRPSTSKVEIKEEKGKQRAESIMPDSRSMPGDPILIPLFDPTKVVNYEREFATNLPFPLSLRTSPATSLQNTFDVDLNSNDSILPFSADQLRNLSLSNRRGLEERLQLLTRVEGVIGGLVEDLTRALSVFPSSNDIDDGDEVKEERYGSSSTNEKRKGTNLHYSD